MPKKKEVKEETEEAKEKAKKKPSQEEFEKKVVELADKGITSEKIGEELRNQGIHPKDYSKKISAVLKEKGKYVDPDIKNIEEKLERLKKQQKTNPQDKRAMREKDRVFSQLSKLKKHFKVAIK
jgi:ribosomal protein S15P/S13E